MTGIETCYAKPTENMSYTFRHGLNLGHLANHRTTTVVPLSDSCWPRINMRLRSSVGITRRQAQQIRLSHS